MVSGERGQMMDAAGLYVPTLMVVTGNKGNDRWGSSVVSFSGLVCVRILNVGNHTEGKERYRESILCMTAKSSGPKNCIKKDTINQFHKKLSFLAKYSKRFTARLRNVQDLQ
jgi:hypothetical protein